MLKKTKFYVALALIAQAAASVVAFIVLLTKKKSSAFAFLAIGGVSGAAGAYLMNECIDEESIFDEYCDCECDECEDKEECELLEAEEEAAEAEEEVEDFDLEGEPFSRAAEAKENE